MHPPSPQGRVSAWGQRHEGGWLVSSTGWGPAHLGLMLSRGTPETEGDWLAQAGCWAHRGRGPAAGKGTGPSPCHPQPRGTATRLILCKRAGTANEEHFLKAKSHYILDSADLLPTPEPSIAGTPEFTDLAPMWILLPHMADFGFVLKLPRGTQWADP